MKPDLNDKGEAWLEMGVSLVSESGDILLDEVCAFEMESRLKKDRRTLLKDLDLKEGCEELKKAKWWAPDRLFEVYGGEAYASFIGRERLEFERDEGPLLLYVNVGDLLIWKDEQWQVAGDRMKSEPLARLIHISPYKMEWELWDKSGLEHTRVTHNREKAPGMTLRIEEVFNRMRQRTISRVSCCIDNKTKVLKQGDWLIHLSPGWHILKTL